MEQQDAGTTVFGNDATACGVVSAEAKLYNTILPGADVASIKRFLERPVVWAQGTIGASPGTLQTRSFTNPSSFRSILGTLNWDRMKGAVGFRATMVFHVAVTRSAFNQGIIAACFQYGTDNLFNTFRGNHFPLSVHLPNVRMNIADETLMELSVPYVSMQEYWPIEALLGPISHNYGAFALVNLTGARVVAGQDAPRYTIYISLRDVEIIGSLPFETTTFVLQGGVAQSSKVTSADTTIRRNKPDVVSKEVQTEGLVSGTLDRMAAVADVASAIPGLDMIGGSADWFLRGLSGAAKAFGFSRPKDETLVTRMTRYAYAGESQVDQPTNAFALAPFASNKLAVNGKVGSTEEDQMAFDYILTKYSYIFRGTLDTAASPGDIIYGTAICPNHFWYRDRTLGTAGPTGNVALKASNSLTENTFYPSTLCYVGNGFRYWRGGFKFRFSFAKTKLHGGRVQVAYLPFFSNPLPNQAVGNTIRIPLNTGGLGPQATGYTMIFDLQDASQFEFEVPYISQEPYSRIYADTGYLSMAVVQPLRSNGTAPTTVDFMVEVCATPGFEFAVTAPSMMQTVPRDGTVAVVYQTGLDMATSVENSSENVIGEKFNSVKQIIMQPDFYSQDLATAGFFRADIEPWFKTNTFALATPPTVNPVVLWFASRSSRMADMYSFANGSTMSIIVKEKGNDRITHSYRYAGTEGGQLPSTPGNYYDKNGNIYSSVFVPDTMESGRVIVPLYSRFERVNVSTSTPWFGGPYSAPGHVDWSINATSAQPQLIVRNTSGSTVRFVVGRAAADDAMLSQFVGPPPVAVLNILSGTNPAYGSATVSEF